MVQHEASTPGGYVHEWLERRGADTDVLHIYDTDRDVAATEFDVVISLGSEESAYDDLGVPWLGRELALLRDAAHSGVPVLGICFGGQLLARALGGEACRAKRAEIGWFEIQTSDAALVPPGPWFQWHRDTLVPPPGAQVIADTAVGAQAYVLGRSIGLQFHPEVTSEIVAIWAADSGDELQREGVDPDQLVAHTQRRGAQSRAAALRLFDGLLENVTGDGTERR